MQRNPSEEPANEDQPEPHDLHAEQDGRNREWEDRARVNLEITPDDVHTNLERDFEPETEPSKKEEPPAY